MTDIAISGDIEGLENLSLKLDVSAMAAALTQYVVAGSQKNNLSVTDLTVVMPTGSNIPDNVGVKDLFEAGSDLFSSLIYQELDATLRAKIPLTTRDLSMAGRTLTAEGLSTMLFIDYFYIFTQARHPTKEMDTIGTADRPYKPAQFILNTIGSSLSFADIENFLFVKGLAKIPMGWVKSVPVKDLSTEAQNRFLLGAAGHRLIQAFASIDYITETPIEVKGIWELLIKYTQDGYSWNFHTAFRSVMFVRSYKSLNKILEGLLATYGKPEDIEVALQDKVRILYRKPIADSRYKDYKPLINTSFKNFMDTDKIFTA